MTTNKTNGTARPVIVTTAHRGVFFGYAHQTDGETIKLDRARLCAPWPDWERAAKQALLGSGAGYGSGYGGSDLVTQ